MNAAVRGPCFFGGCQIVDCATASLVVVLSKRTSVLQSKGAFVAVVLVVVTVVSIVIAMIMSLIIVYTSGGGIWQCALLLHKLARPIDNNATQHHAISLYASKLQCFSRVVGCYSHHNNRYHASTRAPTTCQAYWRRTLVAQPGSCR